MQLLSVNVSLPEPVEIRGKTMQTGINKKTISGPVMVRNLNIDGDRQANLNFHGGIHQAVYVYSIENYQYWADKLGAPAFDYGYFGENLTVTGMIDTDISIGDRFQAGKAEFEVTQPWRPFSRLPGRQRQMNYAAPGTLDTGCLRFNQSNHKTTSTPSTATPVRNMK